MIKEKYEKTEMEVIKFETDDVIMTSYEGDKAMIQMPLLNTNIH